MGKDSLPERRLVKLLLHDATGVTSFGDIGQPLLGGLPEDDSHLRLAGDELSDEGRPDRGETSRGNAEKTIEQCGGHLGIAEDGGPFSEGQVGGDDDRGALV